MGNHKKYWKSEIELTNSAQVDTLRQNEFVDSLPVDNILEDDKSLKVETLVGYLIVDRAQVVRIVDNVITEDTQEYVPEQIRESYTPPPMPKLAQPRYTSPSNSAMNASAKFSANCVLVGNISEKKDGQGNIIFDGEIKKYWWA